MTVNIVLAGQLQGAAGTAQESYAFDQPPTLAALMRQVADRHGRDMERLLLTPDSRPQPSVLVAVGDRSVSHDAPLDLKDGDTVTLLTFIGGG